MFFFLVHNKRRYERFKLRYRLTEREMKIINLNDFTFHNRIHIMWHVGYVFIYFLSTKLNSKKFYV